MRKREEKKDPPRTVRLLGPGIVTGASDDDPSGIATYSQVGAEFGFSMLWSVLLCLPLMVAIQQICARLGRVTGKGLAANLREHTPAKFLWFVVTLVVVANVINIAADISALGSALALVIPGRPAFFSLLLTIISLLLQIFIPYHRYVSVLKWLTLSLLSYVAVLFLIKIPWGEVVRATFIPQILWTQDYVTGIVAVLGTTISPYLFFWQASEEVEEERLHSDEHPLRDFPNEATYQLHRIRVDTWVGMISASIVFYCIVLTVAVTLHQHGITDITTASDAALALRPLAGAKASLLFALGVLGTGLLAIPVLAGSAAYAVGEALDIQVGLEKQPSEAKGFYGLIVLFTGLGLLMNILEINPMKALFWSAVINGVAAGPIMIAVMKLAQKKVVMGQFVLHGSIRWVGWIATGVMLLASAWFFVSLIIGF